MRIYLAQHYKDRFEEDFIAQCEISEQKSHSKDGMKILVDTPPLDKFRLIFPLAEPVKPMELGSTDAESLEMWENAVTGLARNTLGVHFDTSCTDPSRLFYTARHPKGAEDWYCAVVRGYPLRFEDIEPMRKSSYTSKRDVNAFLEAAGDDGRDDLPPMALTPSGASLNEWHRSAKERFLLADLMEDMCSDKIRRSGGEAQGTVHTECPFEHEHSSEGGTATMAVNALDSESGYWTWFCHHDACQGRHKLEFLEEALAQDWFDERLLFDEDEGYLLPLPDEEQEESRKEDALSKLLETADGLNAKSPDGRILKLLKMANADLSLIGGTGKAELLSKVHEMTGLGKRELSGMWKDAASAHHDDLLNQEAAKRAAMETPDYLPVSEASHDTIRKAAEASKWLPKGFVHSKGWFCQKREEETLRVSREFEVLYLADGNKGSSRTNEVSIRYQHRTPALGIVESTFRIGDTYKDSGSILGRLRNEGLDFSPNASTDAVLTLLRSVNSDREAVYVERSGWLSQSVFVSPTGEVVKKQEDSKLYVLDHTMRVSSAKAGTLATAVEAADAALRGRNAKRFLPGFLGGAVGCLANFLDEELAVIIANEGKAKHGKTTSLKAGISWFAVPAADGLLITGNVTPTAMEAKAVESSGAMFAPDEQGTSKASASDEQASVLQYAGRIGRARGKTDGTLRDVNTWHGCMGMSTERGLLDRLEAEQLHDSSVEIRSGAMSRIFTVSYDSAVKLSREEDGNELAAYEVLAHGGAYGWLGPNFARALIDLGLDEVKGRVSALASSWSAGRSGAADRVVNTAALFGVAAQISQEVGLLPKDIDLLGMLEELLSESLDQRAHHLDTERQASDSFRRNIIRCVNSHEIVEVHCQHDARGEILGYFKQERPGRMGGLSDRIYYLPEDRLKRLVKIETSALVERLRNEGALVEPGTGSKHHKRGLHEYTPGEGKHTPNVRVRGSWVHGELSVSEEKTD